MAQTGPVGLVSRCPFLGEDRKSWAERQTDANDPGCMKMRLRLGSQRFPDQRSNPACRTLHIIEQSAPLIYIKTATIDRPLHLRLGNTDKYAAEDVWKPFKKAIVADKSS